MSQNTKHNIAQAAMDQALALGADIAGIAAWAEVLAGPSYQIQPYLKAWSGISGGANHKPTYDDEGGPQPASVLVLGLAHPVNRPEMDWWQAHLPRRTMGNDLLADLTQGLADRLMAEHGVRAWDMPYFPGRGGVFLKDAAVLAGLGCVGRNNLFIAPKHGPRIRLRAMGMDLELPSSGAIDFDPCADCDAPCRRVCPQDALNGSRAADEELPFQLPARDGVYDRKLCNDQMESDIAAHRMITPPGYEQPSKQVHYCRRCEIACKAGWDRKKKQ